MIDMDFQYFVLSLVAIFICGFGAGILVMAQIMFTLTDDMFSVGENKNKRKPK